MTTLPNNPVNDVYHLLTEDRSDEAVSVILKLRGETCDIDCLYCYEKRKEGPGGQRITAEQAATVAQIFHGRPVSIELHGGEPLTLGHDQMAQILDALATQPNVIRVSLQTNGVRLDDAWLDLFDEHCPDLRIGISLDGDKLGSAWRVDYSGQDTYERAATALTVLARRGRTAGVITVVTPLLLGRADQIIDSLTAFAAVNAVSLVPCFDIDVTEPTANAGNRRTASRVLQASALAGPSQPGWATTPQQYADFVLTATARWIATGAFRRIKLDPAVSIIRRLHGLRSDSCHFNAQKCHHIFTLYPDGRFGSCDELPWPQAQLAILTDRPDEQATIERQRRLPLLTQTSMLAAKCQQCDYKSTCGGGCSATRLRFATANGSDDAYCAHRTRMIDGVAALLATPHDLNGAFCETIRWRPRSPNTMRDVESFLYRWNNPTASRTAARLSISDLGNINTVGMPGIQEADDLDPLHPQWHAGIEERVRPLIEVVTAGWDSVTYDSCQGHPASSTSLASSLRVGILPRSPQEASTIGARLCRAVTSANPLLPAECRTHVGRSSLTCESTGRRYPTLDLVIEPAFAVNWSAYLEALPEAVEVLANSLRSTTGENCSCAAEAKETRSHTP